MSYKIKNYGLTGPERADLCMGVFSCNDSDIVQNIERAYRGFGCLLGRIIAIYMLGQSV